MAKDKLRLTLDAALVRGARNRFPHFVGTDAEFLKWFLTTFNAGLIQAGIPTASVPVPQSVPSPTYAEQPSPASADDDDELDPNELLDDDDLLGSETD